MSAHPAARIRPLRWNSGTWAALATFVTGLAVLLLRPPIPIDETRYIEVFRESLRGSPLLLHLLGEPYAEKPPLLFWLARALTWLSIAPDFAVRFVPVLAATAAVLVVDRVGRRIGLTIAGCVQAALCIGSLGGQFLHFDPLVTLSVWAAMDAWLRRSRLGFSAWSAAALLAKGPVAYLFLIPFAWSLAPLRERRKGDTPRAALDLVLALIPLAAWAISAAIMGGDAFARALLWDRWAGRVVGNTPHARGDFFYLPVVLVGSLPMTLLLFRRGQAQDEGIAREWSRRLGWALLAVFVMFSLISGKQAHYLEPAAPGLALWLAWRIESRPYELTLLRLGARLQFGILLVLAVAGALLLPRVSPSVGTRGNELLAAHGFLLPMAIGALVGATGLVLSSGKWLSARDLLLVTQCGFCAGMLPAHWLAGELLFPHELARALDSRPTDVAYLGSSHHGIYALLASRPQLEKLRDAVEVSSWSKNHPDSLVLADPEDLGDVPPGLVVVARDVVHRAPVIVLRRKS